LLLVELKGVAIYDIEAGLFMNELIGCLIQLVDMVAKVLRGG
jgi:hypothetical protein